jgi:hypothetical protein
MLNFVDQFEKDVAKFYGAPYAAVAVNCCTHAIVCYWQLTHLIQLGVGVTKIIRIFLVCKYFKININV